ncbi:HMA2 domain-containing protein [Neobacillus sp. NPDC093127]|uniref:HMA2 domain-containing protein n=1 Tax=Neobacillus sp. NPDC093127 TaxID=3364296 RepID=UPI00381588AA
MLHKVKELQLANRMKKVLKRHAIEIAHQIPGRIRLKSPNWKNSPHIVNQLINQFKHETRIFSIDYTAETGSLLITYDYSPIDHIKQLEAWVEQIESVSIEGEKQ